MLERLSCVSDQELLVRLVVAREPAAFGQSSLLRGILLLLQSVDR